MAKPKRPYHRENLEEKLLEKAAEIIATRGVDALSLRELGRAADVSRAASYHYFPDKSALLARVGQLGFQRLGQRIATEIGEQQEPLQQLRMGLLGYVMFASEQPHFFRLMFSNVLQRNLELNAADQNPALQFSSIAAMDAFKSLMLGIIEMQSKGILRKAEPLLVANVFWSFAHGIAVLAAGQNLKQYEAIAVFEEGISALIDTYKIKE